MPASAINTTVLWLMTILLLGVHTVFGAKGFQKIAVSVPTAYFVVFR
jgi:hypothetical protein